MLMSQIFYPNKNKCFIVNEIQGLNKWKQCKTAGPALRAGAASMKYLSDGCIKYPVPCVLENLKLMPPTVSGPRITDVS